MFEPHTIHEGKLDNGQALRSHNGHFRAVMQSDGNFVIYQGSKVLFATNTDKKGHAPYHIYNQGDFNLVLYDSKRTPLWKSDTHGKGHGKPRLTMQDDGNLVLYDSDNKAVWASNTVTKLEAPSHAWVFPQGRRMHENESLVSENKLFKATFQGDGNFVLYHGSKAIWASNTNGKGRGPRFLDLQHDHNLVIYDADGKAPWATATNSKGKGPVNLILQNDGNLILEDADKKALWTSGTGGAAAKLTGKNSQLKQNESLIAGPYKAIMQSDGNFVIYHDSKAIWATNTNGKGSGPYHLIIQGDDNLVLYDGAGHAHWATATNGKATHGDLRLEMQRDGNLVLYSGSVAIWASNTNGK